MRQNKEPAFPRPSHPQRPPLLVCRVRAREDEKTKRSPATLIFICWTERLTNCLYFSANNSSTQYTQYRYRVLLGNNVDFWGLEGVDMNVLPGLKFLWVLHISKVFFLFFFHISWRHKQTCFMTAWVMVWGGGFGGGEERSIFCLGLSKSGNALSRSFPP